MFVIALLFGVVAGAGIAMVDDPQPASAGTGLVYTVVDADNDPYNGIYLRDGASMASVQRIASRYMLYGTRIELICGTNGEAVGPNANRRWHKVTVVSGATTGQVGFIADRYLNTPNVANQRTPGEPECGAQAPTGTQAPRGTYISRGAPLFLCVNTANAGCRPPGMPSVSANQAANMVCWKDGSNFTGDYTTNRWFWITGPSGEGYVSASVVRNQTAVPACDSKPAFVAAEAAVARNGQTYASAADRTLFADSEWRPGPIGEWAGDCVKLPYVGWRAAGVSIPKGNAINNYNAVRARIQGGVPPRGAVAFYNVARPYGHEVISLGNGFVATTVGMDGAGFANTVKPYTAWGSYLGWYMP